MWKLFHIILVDSNVVGFDRIDQFFLGRSGQLHCPMFEKNDNKLWNAPWFKGYGTEGRNVKGQSHKRLKP